MADKKLRYPFKVAYQAGAYTSKTINNACDYGIDKSTVVMKSAMDSSYVKQVTKTVTTISQDVQTKAKPYTAKVQPYVQPVVPYLDKAKPYVPPAVLALAVLVTMPVVFVFSLIALLTAPIWMTFGLLTSFIWVPVVVVLGLVLGTLAAVLGFVGAVRYFSLPTGYAKLQKYWKKISSTPMGQKVFFVK